MSSPEDGRGGIRASLPLATTAAAVLTVLCCIGLSAVTAVVSAGGAAFLLRDTTLRPLLLGVLALTVAAGVVSWRRHRNPVPVLLTAIAAVALYGFIFGPWHGQRHEDHMPDAMQGPAHSALSGSRSAFVWGALALLIGAQIWGVIAVRRSRHTRSEAAA